jgi:two-component system response regulator RegA
LAGDSGLGLIPDLLALDPTVRIVVLTGYASIATAVEAIKLGAVHYLAKPADADQSAGRVGCDWGRSRHPGQRPSLERQSPGVGAHSASAARQRRQHLRHRAQQLGMHRRTLQRKLIKRPVKL